jgi:hypothetical protein
MRGRLPISIFFPFEILLGDGINPSGMKRVALKESFCAEEGSPEKAEFIDCLMGIA